MFKQISVLAALSSIALPALAGGMTPAPPTTAHIPAEAPNCAPFMTQVYFQSGTTELSPQAERAIEAASDRADGCAVTAIEMVALSADAETEAAAEQLAASRLAQIERSFGSTGLKSDDVRAEIIPARFDSPTTEPMARRVEILIAAYQPEIG